jgi:hypothetical protein
MTRRLTMAQVACGLVAGVGIALGATAGLVLAASLYHGGSKAVPIVAASKTGARPPARPPNAVEAVDESGRSAAVAAKKPSAKHATVTRKHASRSHRRAAHVKKRPTSKQRPASKPATVLVRQTAPATTAPARQLAQTAPVRTPTPARTTPSKPAAEPTRSASGSGTFDDSG